MTDTDRLDRIEEILLTQAGRLDMLTAQVAKTSVTVDRLALTVDRLSAQVDRLVAGMVMGFTQRDERLAAIDQKLDALDRIVTPPAP